MLKSFIGRSNHKSIWNIIGNKPFKIKDKKRQERSSKHCCLLCASLQDEHIAATDRVTNLDQGLHVRPSVHRHFAHWTAQATTAMAQWWEYLLAPSQL